MDCIPSVLLTRRRPLPLPVCAQFCFCRGAERPWRQILAWRSHRFNTGGQRLLQPSSNMQNQKRSHIPIPDGKENPSIKKPARDRTPPPSRASCEPLSPTQPKVATAPQQPPEATSSQPAASGASAPHPYWPRATPHGASYNALHASLPNGVVPHDWLDVPTMQPPDSLPRGNRTVGGFLHYPRETPHEGYCTPTFGGTDETVCMLTGGVNQGMPTGVKVPFVAQWDYFDDLDGPRPLKVGTIDYSFRKHFWKKLTLVQQKQWRASKVRKLASVMADEIVERGRVGMDAFVAGDCPLEFWPELLTDAAAIARQETGRPYDIAFPPDLPPLQPLKEGEDAPEVGKYELQHPSGAAPGRFMSFQPPRGWTRRPRGRTASSSTAPRSPTSSR